jgi:hypothetical protein
MGHYNNSIISALMHLFPEIDLVVENFYDMPSMLTGKSEEDERQGGGGCEG